MSFGWHIFQAHISHVAFIFLLFPINFHWFFLLLIIGALLVSIFPKITSLLPSVIPRYSENPSVGSYFSWFPFHCYWMSASDVFSYLIQIFKCDSLAPVYYVLRNTVLAKTSVLLSTDAIFKQWFERALVYRWQLDVLPCMSSRGNARS